MFHVAALLGVPTEEDREEIAKEVKHKWRLFGLQLGIDKGYLDEISREYSSDNARCSSELFRRWASRELPADRPFTWRGVIEILDGSLVRETSLARKLEERKHWQHQTPKIRFQCTLNCFLHVTIILLKNCYNYSTSVHGKKDHDKILLDCCY